MSEPISGYLPVTPMRTAGSGSARWCFATRGLERFFLKEFLSPVWPADESTPLGLRQMERCEAFERQKQRLYTALSCVIGETLVPVIDFFQYERRYYAVSEAVNGISAEEAENLTADEKRRLLYEVALCLQRLHTQGIVHADLKPDHVLLLHRPDSWQPRLIDLDSGFLTDDPPRHLEGDPAYLAPETFLRMVDQSAALTPALDTFAFGAMIHQLWTGSLPAFDQSQYHYLYEAALDGGRIVLSDALPEEYHACVLAMLAADPADRPSDTQVTALFDQSRPDASATAKPVNGLMRLMRT